MECPTVYPSWEEFSNFEKYIEELERQNPSYGMVKVVPPKRWTARKRGYEDLNFRLTHPIRQEVYGLAGVYNLFLISEKSMDSGKYETYAKTQELKKSLTDEEIEKLFWKKIRFNAAIYGADSQNETLFDEDTPWGLSKLDTLLDRGLRPMKLPGINQSFLYLGCWKSMFCWHTEDLDLYSINYLHFGKPKFWYSIPSTHTERFENFMRFQFHDSYRNCKEFLRHKSSMVSPKVLKDNGIPVQKIVQREGEFIVIFAKIYHSGFNSGYNCAEAVNFATDRWVDIGKRAGRCMCQKGSVNIDMSLFESKLPQKRQRKNK